MAAISQTILEKISRSAAMVADVTPIDKSAGAKALTNSNVMVDLGYAMRAIEFERIIDVLIRRTVTPLKSYPSISVTTEY